MLTLDPRTVEAESVRKRTAEIAGYLQDTIGQKVTAYLAGVEDPKLVGRWSRGEIQPRGFAETRLRHGYLIVRMLVDAYDAETAKAWLYGSNSRLDDRAPALILRKAERLEDIQLLVPVAKAFARSEG
jgi:hypothetical protein